MWNVTNVSDGPQGAAHNQMNQIPHGAKNAHSEQHGLQQASSQNLNNCHPSHTDMQNNVHKMDSNLRYNSDVASSHTNNGMLSNYLNGNGACRNNNSTHSGSPHILSVGSTESNGSHQNSSYGAQYNSSMARVKNQMSNSDSNSNNANNNETPYSGWLQNPTSNSSSSNNGWNIPNSLLSSGRNNSDSQHESAGSRNEGTSNSNDDNAIVDSENQFNDMIGATGVSDYNEEKQGTHNNFSGSASWGMPPPRIGLLGGGENSSNSGSNGWNNNQNTSSVGSTNWGAGNRQNSGTSNDSGSDVMTDEMNYSGLIGATGISDCSEAQQSGKNKGYPPESASRQMPARIGLLGGGENSMNTPGWGNNHGSTASNGGSGWVGNGRSNNTSSEITGNNGTGMSPPKPLNTWAQAAGRGLNSTSSSNGNGSQTTSTNATTTPTNDSAVSEGTGNSKAYSEDNVMVKAAFSDGWGKTPINQDSAWDSFAPEELTGSKDTASAVWRVTVNNGTDIWENNLRLNKGTPTPIATTTAPPWGHTPATNIGGHWGDDDNTTNNTWSGMPPGNPNAPSAHWPEQNPSANNNPMWNSTPTAVGSDKSWDNGQGVPPWNDGVAVNDNGAVPWNQPPINKQRNVGNWSPATTPKKDVQSSGWEPPSPPANRRPITNYDDGTAVWGNPQRQTKVSHWKDMPPAKPIINSGNNMGPPAGMPPPSSLGGNIPPTGPGMIRLPSGATVSGKGDIASAVWGKNPQSMNRNSSWQDMPSHNNGSSIGNWGDDPSHIHSAMKNIPGASNTPGGAFGNGWGEQANPMSAYWGAKPKGPSNWADGQVDTSSWLGPTKQGGEMMQEGWPASSEELSGNTWPDRPRGSNIGYWNEESPTPSTPGWAGRRIKGGKPLTRDLIWASKQFRLLVEMGVKREDAENALRNNNMNFEEALAELRASSMDGNMMDDTAFHGRKMRPANLSEDISMGDHMLDPTFGTANFHGSSGFQGAGNFQNIPNVPPFKSQVKCSGPNNATSLLNAALSGQQSGIGSLNNFSPAMFQKLLQQQSSLQQLAANMQTLNQANRVGQNFPSNSVLRHLVQQIQIAIHAGHLNPQILNQSLAPQTLQLLYQLLQQIKVLNQLQHAQMQGQHMSKPATGAGPGGSSGLHLNVQLTQTKQRILNLQNQIAAQQAVFLKQQVPQPQQHQPIHNSSQPSADVFKLNVDPIPSLHNDFRDMSLKEAPIQPPQSRLIQWKLPSYEKEENSYGSSSNSNQNMNTSGGGSAFNSEFIRAPGPLMSRGSASASSTIPNAGPNLNPLLGQSDSTWSSLTRSHNDSGWPEAATSISGISENNSSGPNNAVGSSGVSNIGNNSMSQSQQSQDSKEQSTTPPSSGPSTSSASHSSYNLSDLVPEFEPGKPWKGTQLKNIEDDPHITPGSITRSPLSVNTIKDPDLFWNSKSSPAATGNDNVNALSSGTWAFPSNTTATNTTAGSANKSSNSKANWGALSDMSSGSDLWGSKSRPPPGLSGQGWERQTSSTFLLLRNLTPQIDGSTLKTLCMQHGPLQLFHLSLNHGIALVRYSTREEATKAQSALYNCVLGNTTILSEIPNESEVQRYLALLSNQNSTGSMGWSAPQQSSNAPGFRNNTSFPYSSSTGNATASNKQDSTGWNGGMPSQLWSFPNASSALWGSSQPMNDHDSSTNSSIARYLPDDLLSGTCD